MTLKDDILRLLHYKSPEPQMLEDYSKFVLQKAAKDHALYAREFDLLHCALGLATETLELQQSTTAENTEEELGDLLWYLTFTAATLNLSFAQMEMTHNDTVFNAKSNTLPQKNMAAEVEEFVSTIKKKVIYQQEVDLAFPFMVLWHSFAMYCSACNITLHQLVNSNKEKLEKRYKEKFTTEESASRNDKMEGEE